ncbi:MAG: prepilin-type N-terminal cleavage/methylation domain-containing protein [Candidatus Magasanikbacteria bacterium]
MVKKGFTLIELLIVISIIAILASVVFVALDPLKRFQDARDSSRWADISSLVSAVKVYQVDNQGSYPTEVGGMTASTTYMIGTDASGCNSGCTDWTVSQAACIDLTELVTEGYLGEVPVSSNGAGTWTTGKTGYTITKYDTGLVTVAACESENSDNISVSK